MTLLPHLNTGFSVLLRTNGETLNFRSSFVRGVVNRNPLDRVVRTPDFDPRDHSEIQLLTGAVSSIPQPGEADFVDEYGMAHRIQTVKQIGNFYACRCTPSNPSPELLADEDPELFTDEDAEPIQAG